MAENIHLQSWKRLKRTVLHTNPWFRIEKEELVTPQGHHIDYYTQHGKDGIVCVCATDDGKFILERQYRPPIRRVSLDYPAGGIEPGDKNADEAVRREIEEETGYQIGSLKKLASLDRDSGVTDSKIHIYIAQDLHDRKPQQLDPTEEIVFVYATTDEVKRLISAGELCCNACVAATYLVFQELGIS